MAQRMRIAVVGSGIAGMSAAWLLSERHDVAVYERADRLGGHSNTVDAAGPSVPVDTGFIVYNPPNYPNLVGLFAHLGVETCASDMSFAVSLDRGRLEYSGSSLAGLFAQKRNLASPRFWSMLRDLLRFYREAPRAALADPALSLGDFLDRHGYGAAFCDDHLLPMAAAIWSAPPATMRAYPAAAFVRFHANHGLLQLANRPQWRTVVGGSRSYVERLTRRYRDRVRLNSQVVGIRRGEHGVTVRDIGGGEDRFDHVVIAAHADQALAMLEDASPAEQALLGPFRYSRNLAVLHTDATLMPTRRSAWASWNFIGERDRGVTVTYWMNRLQPIAGETDYFVTLNPPRPPHAGMLLHSEVYEHPIFDTAAMTAQQRLWSLQGRRNTWFCGSYFGSGFHEDGLQAGLAVAEALGGVRRPWTVANESGRIHVTPAAGAVRAAQPSQA